MSYSVVIPTYNRAKVLARALDSVLSQTVKAAEVIVVDDGSNDQTQALIANDYPNVIVISQDNQGVSAARNSGFNKVTTEWVALLDSDDEWLPQKMEMQLIELEKTNLLLCHSEEIWIRNGVRINAKNKHKKKRGDIFSDCLLLCAMSPSSIVLHRDIWQEFDGFDEEFIVCEDYDLWLRICAKYEVALIDSPQVKKYGGHADQLSRQYFGMDKFRILAMQKLLNANLSFEQAKQLKVVLQDKLAILYQGALKHSNHELLKFCEQRRHLFQTDI